MRVAGFVFIRNAIKFKYPVKESILSLLPLCDEVIVSIGNSDDDTEALIRSIDSPKIKIQHTIWDDSLKEGGRVLAVETDKAFDAITPGADWCIYLQGDEVLHEADYPAIRAAMELWKDDSRVEGLLFKYKHFYGSYEYIGDSRRWYAHEIRIIRQDPSIRSYRDAQGFRKNGRKLNVKLIDAYIYHYGWVRDPREQYQKHLDFEKLYGGDHVAKDVSLQELGGFDYSTIDSLVKFTGTHPSSMQDLIARQGWHFTADISKKNFNLKGWVLYYVEKYTGKRLWDYQNYTVI